MILGFLRRRRARAAMVKADADALLRECSEAASEEARRRERDATFHHINHGDRPAGHWGRVRHRLRQHEPLDTATRYLDR